MRVFLSVSWESNLAMFKPFTESANYILASTMYYCCSVTKSCPTLCDFMNCSTPGFSVLISQSLLRLMCIALVMPSSHLILCHPLLLLPSLFPRIRVLFCFFFFPMNRLFASGGQYIHIYMQIFSDSFYTICE